MSRQRAVGLIREIKATIAVDQPKLGAHLDRNSVVVDGTYIIAPTTEEFIGQGSIVEYSVCIVFFDRYPVMEPKVFEVGNDIPRNEDFHINPDGSCCLVVWEVWTAFSEDISVQAFFDGPLKNFFLGQFIRKTTGRWPFDEERHGKAGLIDAVAERLGCEAKEKDVHYLLRILSRDWPPGHWMCPCGSGEVIRSCCVSELAKLSDLVTKRKRFANALSIEILPTSEITILEPSQFDISIRSPDAKRPLD